MSPLLEVEGLSVALPGGTRLVEDVSFAIAPAERVALVGESGSGKSVTARALMRLDDGLRLSGRVVFQRTELVGLPEGAMRSLRGGAIGMAFQDPMTSLDPLMTIGAQVMEPLRLRGIPRAEARRRAVAMLDALGVPGAEARIGAWPHEFSGGMRQRVVLAMALVAGPALLLADEPTTALDVRVQRQVLDLLDATSAAMRLSVLLITHDLGIVARFADRVMVMYAGRLVEDSPVQALFDAPLHPYAAGLIAAVPRVDRREAMLATIPGTPATPAARPTGCAFHPRCPLAIARCQEEVPALRRFGPRRAACHRAEEAAHAA